MINVFSFSDYRELLKELYEDKKSKTPGYTYRKLASEAGYNSAGFFLNILNRKRNVSDSIALQLADVFDLKKKEKDFFLLLVKADQAKSPANRKKLFDQALSISHQKLGVKPIGYHRYYEKWYYTAIREAITIKPFKGDYKELAKTIYPPITPGEAKKAIDVLKEIGLLSETKEGFLGQTKPYITSGETITSANLTNFHKETAKLAEAAMEQCKKEIRNISTLTVSLSESSYQQMIDKLRIFRKELMNLSEEDLERDRVYHLNFHLFPMTKIKKSKSKNEE